MNINSQKKDIIDIVVSVAVYIVSVLVFNLSASFKESPDASLNPSMWPRIIALILCIMATIQLINAFREKLTVNVKIENTKEVILSIIFIILYGLCLKRLGYIIDTIVLLIVLLKIFHTDKYTKADIEKSREPLREVLSQIYDKAAEAVREGKIEKQLLDSDQNDPILVIGELEKKKIISSQLVAELERAKILAVPETMIGEKKRRAWIWFVILPVTITAIVYICFKRILRVPLPDGILEAILH